MAVSAVAIAALLLAACGEPVGETGAAESPEAEEPAGTEPAAEEPEGGEDSGDSGDGEETEEEDPPPSEGAEPAEQDTSEQAPADPEAEQRCQIAIGDDDPVDPDDYEPLVTPINGSLEELVYAMDAALTDLEEGGDGPSLETELEQHAETWEELVEPVKGLTPPDGAEEWHGSLVDSWLMVCTAIENGIAGSAEGDDERFQDFVDALRDYPSLVNHLHANAACGPFESC